MNRENSNQINFTECGFHKNKVFKAINQTSVFALFYFNVHVFFYTLCELVQMCSCLYGSRIDKLSINYSLYFVMRIYIRGTRRNLIFENRAIYITGSVHFSAIEACYIAHYVSGSAIFLSY